MPSSPVRVFTDDSFVVLRRAKDIDDLKARFFARVINAEQVDEHVEGEIIISLEKGEELVYVTLVDHYARLSEACGLDDLISELSQRVF